MVKKDLPGTLQRSSKKAQHTFEKTLDAAHDQYDSEERAHRTAFASLKHGFEKVGDHWEEKDAKGPSDPRAKRAGKGNPSAGATAGGVDVEGHTKAELYDRAKALGVTGRSSMTKLGSARPSHASRTERVGRSDRYGAWTGRLGDDVRWLAWRGSWGRRPAGAPVWTDPSLLGRST
ncbi:MAG: ChaB family protein [Acidimicrobiales bacterium]